MDAILSLPLYAMIQGSSVSELQYERVNIRLRPESNNKHFLSMIISRFNEHFEDLKLMVPSEDLTYNNFFISETYHFDDKERLENQAKTMDSIFNVIVLVAMSLCFFSLGSSMSANIFDQSKEIAVLRSIGLNKPNVMKIFIYEALVLVISCSICGFIIGVVIGNLMMLQQAMFTSS